MATLEQFEKNNNVGPEEDVIVDPNIVRQQQPQKSIAELAAEAGYSGFETNKNAKAVNIEEELGVKTFRDQQEEYRESIDTLSHALGPEIEAAAERKKAEMNEFIENLEQCGGEMTKEEMVMMSDAPDFEAMLSNPPDPMNQELKEFTRQQIERFKETASPEELRARGLLKDDEDAPEEPNKVINLQDKVTIHDTVETAEEAQSEEDEDESILMESNDDAITMALQNNAKAVNAVVEEKDDGIMIVDDSRPPVTYAEEDDTNKLDDEEPAKALASKVAAANISKIDRVDLDKELAALDLDSDSDTEMEMQDRKEKMQKVKEDIKNKVLPISSKLDIRGFAVSNVPVSLNNSVNMATSSHQAKSGRWALFSSRMPIVMTELLGMEIDELIKLTRGQNFTASDLIKRYTIFYNHIISPKPDTVDKWLKVVSIMDIKHLYGAAYKATFDNVNYIPYDCENERCGNAFISDNMPFTSIIDYKDSDARKEAESIYRSEPPTDSYSLYTTEIVPISPVYAMAFRDPSIYDAQIAPLYLDPDWYNKMEDEIAIATYIDSIYVIDQQNRAIRPLGIKEYKNDVKKTLKAKVLALAKVLNTLTSDQYNLISCYIEEINKTSDYVNYQMPEIICPECGTKIEARPESSMRMLFTRHRLTSLANG